MPSESQKQSRKLGHAINKHPILGPIKLNAKLGAVVNGILPEKRA